MQGILTPWAGSQQCYKYWGTNHAAFMKHLNNLEYKDQKGTLKDSTKFLPS